MVTAQDVIEIITLAEMQDVNVWLDGGWGVDALLGEQTREHNDVDVFVELRCEDAFVGLLRQHQFAEAEMEYTTPAHTVWCDAKGRIVDLHLFEFGKGGVILFEGASYPAGSLSGEGAIGGKLVHCIPPQEQVFFHLGYEHDETDRRDVLLLCERFGIPVPVEYQ